MSILFRSIMRIFILLFFSFILYFSVQAVTINVATPGTLSSLATNTDITDLTLTGTIDARDFKFLRDGLPSLIVLNMTSVSIAAYTGVDGSGGGTPIVYPANEVPTFAFCDLTTNQGKPTLATVGLPNSLVSFGNSAFWGCASLAGTLTIPSGVTAVGVKAFKDCIGLSGSIVLPVGMKSLEIYAFAGCSGVSDISIPTTVTTIGADCFSGTKMLVNVDVNNGFFSSKDGILYDKAQSVLIHAPNDISGIFTVPPTVTKISVGAFYQCAGLDGVVLDANLTNIGDNAFFECANLAGPLSMPSTLTNIGASAFKGCPLLTGGLIFPETLSVIGTSAFAGCSGFDGKLSLPNSLSTLGGNAFDGCSGLIDTLSIPNKIATVESATFRGCAGFSTIIFPASVTAINGNAFNGNTGLTSIRVNIKTPLSIVSTVFKGVDKSTCTIYVPAGTKPAYQAALQWKDFKFIVETDGFWLSAASAVLAKELGSTAAVNLSINFSGLWTATELSTWLSVSPSVATGGNGVLSFTALTANPKAFTRTATVTITAPGVPSQTILVTQAAGDPVVTIPDVTASIGKDTGSTTSIPITANTTWTVSSDQTWLSTEPTVPTTGNGTLVLTTTAANPTTDIRTAQVTITSPGVTPKTITVTQAAGDPTLSVPTSTASVTKDAGSNATIPITSNSNWTVTSADSWVSLSIIDANTNGTIGPGGKGNGSLIINTLTPNPSIDVRTTTVTINVPGATPKTISVTQAAGDPTLLVSATTAEVAKEAASTATVAVTSNTTWTAVSDQLWLTASPSPFTGNGMLTLTTTSDNLTLGPRTATLTLTAPGVASKTVTVTQSEKITLTFTPKSVLTEIKAYDKNSSAVVTVGLLTGVVPGDDVNVTATGTYDDANVGTGKVITVVYSITGLQANKYKAPSNYTVNTGVITAQSLTLTAQAETKVYDTKVKSLAIPVLTGTLHTGDLITTISQTYESHNVGTNRALIPHIQINDGNGGKNYNITAVNAVGQITPAPVTVTSQADNRVYNATNSSSLVPVVVGVIAPDTIATPANQHFIDKNVGVAKTIVPVGLVIYDGNKGDNYSITFVNNSSGVITAAPITVTSVADSIIYNTTVKSAKLPLVVGVLAPDSMSAKPTQHFDTRHVGVNKSIVSSGLVIADGNSGNNYVVALYVPNNNGVITAAPIVVSAISDSILYNKSKASLKSPLVEGILLPDLMATAPVQTFDNENVGVNKVLTASGLLVNDGNGGNDYIISYETDTKGQISAIPLTVTAQTDSKTYDGSVSSAVSPVVTGTIIAPDFVSTAATQTFDNRNIGISKVLSANGLQLNDGNGGKNYKISYVSNLSGTITALPLTLTAQSDSMVYNGTTASKKYAILTGSLILPDSIIGKATQSFDTPNRGILKFITPDTLKIDDGNAGKNYSVSYVKNNTGLISRAPVLIQLTVATRADNKPYDGTTNALIKNAKLNGVVVTDDVKLDSVIGQFSQSNIGIDLTVNLDMKLVGADIDNYTLVPPASLIASILPKELTVINAIAKDKIYDGDSLAVIEGAVLKGVVGAEDVVLTSSNSGTFSTANADTALVVTTNMQIQGTAISNYTLTQPVLKASILPKPLSSTNPVLPGVKTINGSALPATKIYDGTPVALVTQGDLLDVLPADIGNVGVVATAVYSNAAVGTGKIVTVKYTLTGPAASHYKTPADYIYNAGEIIPKQLTITGTQVVKNKMVDGKTIAIITSLGTIQGRITADVNTAILSATANYDTPDTAKVKTITVVYTLTGTTSANYIVPVNEVINDGKITDIMRLNPLVAPSAGCEGSDLGLGYSFLTGQGFNYKIVFNPSAKTAGMKDIPYNALASTAKSGILSIPVPVGTKDGNYSAKLYFKNELNIETDSLPFNFSINVSADYIVAKFDDVVLCNNASNRFAAYQWFKDGVKLEGATKQFYWDKDRFSGAYSVQVTTTDGKVLMSCPKTIVKSKVKSIFAYPNPLKVNQTFTVDAASLSEAELLHAVITIYNLQGTKVFESKKIESLNKLDLHIPVGIYVGKLVTSSGVEHNFEVAVGQ